MQTKEGALKARETNIEKHGSLEAWKEFQRKNGAKGGKATHEKGQGFAANRERASRAGKIGGKISKPGTRKNG